MAYVPVDEEEQKKQQQADAGGADQQGSERVLSGEGGDINAGTGQGSSQPAQGTSSKGSQGSTGWTNLQKYVDANRGSDAAMGSRVSDVAGQKAQQASSAEDTYRGTADSDIAAGTVRDNGLINRIKTSPTDVNKDEYYQQANAQYQGPGSYNSGDLSNSYGQAQGQVGNLVDTADKSSTLEGRTALLDQAYGRPSYTSGEKRLDSFLLGAGDQGKQAISNIQQNYGSGSQFNKGWNDLINNVSGNINNAKATTAQTAADTQKALGDTLGNYTTTLGGYKQQLDQEASTNAAAYKKVQGQLGSNDIDQRAEGWKALGVDPKVGEFMRSQGVPLSNIVAAGQARKIGDVASDQEIANYNALNDLAGKTSDFDLSKTGNSGSAYDLNSGTVGAGKDAEAMYEALQGQLAQAQHKRNADLGTLESELSPFGTAQRSNMFDNADLAKRLGVDASSLGDAETYHVDPHTFLKENQDISLGDVATDAQRKGWSDLMSKLGITTPKVNLSSRNPADAFSFDKNGFLSAVEAAKAQAAANRPIPQTVVPTGSPDNSGSPDPIYYPDNPGAGALQRAGNSSGVQGTKKKLKSVLG